MLHVAIAGSIDTLVRDETDEAIVGVEKKIHFDSGSANIRGEGELLCLGICL